MVAISVITLLLRLMWLITTANASSWASSSSTCSHVVLRVPATSQSILFANPPNPKNATDILEFFHNALDSFPTGPATNGTVTRTGIYTINGWYCRPSPGPRPHRHGAGVLQVLVHGSTLNRTCWNGMGFGDLYNYQLFAAKRGYHTLAIDRPGHGENLRAQRDLDPLVDIQIDLMVEVLHGIAVQVKSSTKALGRRFSKLVFMGHSYGAAVLNPLGRDHPSDADALIFTSYSSQPDSPPYLGQDLDAARNVWPKRHGKLRPGYLTFRTESVRQSLLYAGAFDKRLPHTDYIGEDVMTPSELLLSSPALLPVTGYRGKVFVLTAELDLVNCSPNVGPCNENLNATRVLFPDAAVYDYYAPPNTGHSFMMHYSAPKSFAVLHDWLDKFF